MQEFQHTFGSVLSTWLETLSKRIMMFPDLSRLIEALKQKIDWSTALKNKAGSLSRMLIASPCSDAGVILSVDSQYGTRGATYYFRELCTSPAPIPAPKIKNFHILHLRRRGCYVNVTNQYLQNKSAADGEASAGRTRAPLVELRRKFRLRWQSLVLLTLVYNVTA